MRRTRRRVAAALEAPLRRELDRREELRGAVGNKWTRLFVIAVGALIVIALLIRVFFSRDLQNLLNWTL